MSAKWPTAIDLFCGCGAVTQGLKLSHFRVVAAVDNDPIACSTYEENHRTVDLLRADITKINPKRMRKELLAGEDLDLLVICAPCQPFSSQNQSKIEDERMHLILESVRFARALRPRVVFFENVPGLKREKFSTLLNELQTKFSELGYSISEPLLVDAADFGVPQRRSRCLMFAGRGNLPIELPPPTTPTGKRVTVRKAIGDLSRLQSGDHHPKDLLHFARKHHVINLERLRHIPKDGGGRSSLPPHLRLACHDGHRGHPDVYGRMKWDDVAPTLTTGCNDLTRGRFAHPEDDRSLSLREAARLQTFPDHYRFFGSVKQIATQIGNAVPVRLIQAIAPTLRKALRDQQNEVHETADLRH